MKWALMFGVLAILLVGCGAPRQQPPPLPMPTTPEGKAAARACLSSYQSCTLPCQFMGWAIRGGCFDRCEKEKRTCFELAE